MTAPVRLVLRVAKSRRYRELDELPTWVVAVWAVSLAASTWLLAQPAWNAVPAYVAMIDAGHWGGLRALYFIALLSAAGWTAWVFGRACQKQVLPVLDEKLGLS
jgi:hypothetical protein